MVQITSDQQIAQTRPTGRCRQIDCMIVEGIVWSRSNSRWDFHFHYYMLTITFVSIEYQSSQFLLSCTQGVHTQGQCTIGTEIFSCVCSTDSFSCSERKNWKKTRLKQGSKTKEGKSKRCCRHQSNWIIIALRSHRYCSAVTPISLRCCSVVAPLSHRYCTGIAPLLLRCCRSCCCYVVAPLLQPYCSTVSLLLLLLLLLHSRTAIALLSRRCRTAVAPSQIGYKQFNIELLLLYCHSTVASAVNRKVHTVVPSRGIIRVTVTIGDCQARVSSSSEGCWTLQKTVKVESY